MFKKLLVLQVVLSMTAGLAMAGGGDLLVLKTGGAEAISVISSIGARTEIARVLKMPESEIARINKLAPKAALEAIQAQISRIETKGNSAELDAQLAKVVVSFKSEIGNTSGAKSSEVSGFSSKNVQAGNGANSLAKKPTFSSKATRAMNADGNFSAVTRDLVRNVPSEQGANIAAIASSPIAREVISPKLPETCRNSKIVGDAAVKLGDQYVYIANALSADGKALTAKSQTEITIQRSNGVLEGFTAEGRQYNIEGKKDCAGAIRAGRILAEKAFNNIGDFKAGVNAELGICPTTPPVIMSEAAVDMSTCQLR